MSKSITFEAIISGDQECFCWDVTHQQYIAVMGQEYYDKEIQFEKESHEFGKKYYDDVTEFDSSKLQMRLYPSDIFGVILNQSILKLPNSPLKFTISIDS